MPRLDFVTLPRHLGLCFDAAYSLADYRRRRFGKLAAAMTHIIAMGAAAIAARCDCRMRHQDDQRTQRK